jgi:hypothetical protein
MMETSEKVRETKLRRRAARYRLRLSRAAVRDRLAPDYGTYAIMDANGSILVRGLPLDEVEAALLAIVTSHGEEVTEMTPQPCPVPEVAEYISLEYEGKYGIRIILRDDANEASVVVVPAELCEIGIWLWKMGRYAQNAEEELKWLRSHRLMTTTTN